LIISGARIPLTATAPGVLDAVPADVGAAGGQRARGFDEEAT
jgi:hypothetical protein